LSRALANRGRLCFAQHRALASPLAVVAFTTRTLA